MIDADGDRVRFDDIVGGHWTVLHTGTDAAAGAWRSAGVPVLRIAGPGSAPGADRIVDRDGTLLRWLEDKKTSVIALRPDGFVYAGGTPQRPLPHRRPGSPRRPTE